MGSATALLLHGPLLPHPLHVASEPPSRTAETPPIIQSKYTTYSGSLRLP